MCQYIRQLLPKSKWFSVLKSTKFLFRANGYAASIVNRKSYSSGIYCATFRSHGGEGAETHFKCVLVSPDFVGKRALQRHQAVYALVTDEMSKGLHALALHTYTPDEWAVIQQAPDSPACQHKQQGA